MNTRTDLVVTNPGTLMAQAQDVAGVCAEIVKRTAKLIQGRKYVCVEGWQAIAVVYGCVASSKAVERVPGGVRAIGEIRRVSDGALISTAEGFVGEDEPTWFGGESKDKYGKVRVLPKRPDFAIQAMAQTRAISRACRSAFAFVVVLIDSNLSTTPAEEMMGVVSPAEDAPQVDDRPKITKEQITAIENALKETGVEMATLLTRTNLTDIKELASDDAVPAITWIRTKAKPTKAPEKAKAAA